MALSFEKEFISHCKKQNLEINPSQIDLVKKLQEYYEGNFQSLISKIFQSQSFKKGILFIWRCWCRQNNDFRFLF